MNNQYRLFNRRWQVAVKYGGQSTVTVSQRLSPVVIGRGLFVLFILCILLFATMVKSYAQSQQCFADPQQAYAYLIAQQQQQRLQAEQTQQNTVININQASEAELTGLSGIGSQKAQQIILYREAFGPFTSVDALAEVKGIGIQTVAKNRHRVVVQ